MFRIYWINRTPIIFTTNKFLIAWAWGPLRVTSNTRYGKLESPYAGEVGAAWRLWLRWFYQGTLRWIRYDVKIVIPTVKTSEKKKILDSVSHLKPQDVEERPTLSEAEIEILLEKRKQYRSEKNFTESDKIRDYLIEHGVQVNDQKLK